MALEAENLYHLTTEQLTMPEGGRFERLRWLRGLVDLQREGIDHGERPQNPVLPAFTQHEYSYADIWRRRVWNYYLKNQHGGSSLGIVPGSSTQQRKYLRNLG